LLAGDELVLQRGRDLQFPAQIIEVALHVLHDALNVRGSGSRRLRRNGYRNGVTFGKGLAVG
jgi:hypothetical protein